MSDIELLKRKAVTHLISSRDFARDLKAAKQAAQSGPVIITSRGKPEFALIRYEIYQQLAGGGATQGKTLWEVMSELPDTSGVDFEPPTLGIGLRVPDLLGGS